MGNTVWSGPVQPLSSAAGPAVTAAVLTTGTPLPAPIIPVNALALGSRLVLEADVELTSTSATPTIILGFYIGAVGGAIGSAAVLAVTGALVINVAATGWLARIRYKGTIRTLSPTVASIYGNGTSESWFNVGLTGAPTVGVMPATVAARTVSTLNTQQNNQLDVGITLSSVTGTPTATVTNFFAELLG